MFSLAVLIGRGLDHIFGSPVHVHFSLLSFVQFSGYVFVPEKKNDFSIPEFVLSGINV